MLKKDYAADHIGAVEIARVTGYSRRQIARMAKARLIPQPISRPPIRGWWWPRYDKHVRDWIESNTLPANERGGLGRKRRAAPAEPTYQWDLAIRGTAETVPLLRSAKRQGFKKLMAALGEVPDDLAYMKIQKLARRLGPSERDELGLALSKVAAGFQSEASAVLMMAALDQK